MSHPKEHITEDGPLQTDKFRVTQITVRANRAIAPFVHVRAEVSVSILKGGDAEAAREHATRECHKAINSLAYKELRPSNVLDPVEDFLPGIQPEKEPF